MRPLKPKQRPSDGGIAPLEGRQRALVGGLAQDAVTRCERARRSTVRVRGRADDGGEFLKVASFDCEENRPRLCCTSCGVSRAASSEIRSLQLRQSVLTRESSHRLIPLLIHSSREASLPTARQRNAP